MPKEITDLIKDEGWEITWKEGKQIVLVNGTAYPVVHPFSIHSKIYREETNPEIKYQSLRRMHALMWPKLQGTWNYWDERRFRAHCEGHNYITYAGGASTGKSHCGAMLAILFFFADPAHRAVLIASTTLESLDSRIFGYCIRLLSTAEVPLVYTHRQGMPPKILYNTKDKIHGMFAIAAKRGDDEKAISSIIGRHPDRALLVLLDEATDMPPALLKALPNLSAGGIEWQVVAIGNSNSKFDLHGALSTPKDGWKNIDPLKVNRWETTQKNGICLFFSCYESPAIFEQDPVKRSRLAQFFITEKQIEEKAKLYGSNSDSFWRFVLGFWRDDGSDDVVLSKVFLDEFNVRKITEWSGFYPLQIVGGLDVAFSTGGDAVILRLAILGQDTEGRIVLDFRKEELLFRIKILANAGKSAELQIADAVIKILSQYNCSLGNIAIDANGQGRAVGELIRVRAAVLEMPIKIYSVRIGSGAQDSFDVTIKSTLELWTDIRDFIQTDQIRGLDETTIGQLTSRLIEVQSGSGKRVLEKKLSYKSRMGSISPTLAHSPDEADACALALQVAKIKFGFRPGQRRDIEIKESFELEKWHAQLMAKQVEENHSQGYSPPIADFSADIHALVDTFGKSF